MNIKTNSRQINPLGPNWTVGIKFGLSMTANNDGNALMVVAEWKTVACPGSAPVVPLAGGFVMPVVEHEEVGAVMVDGVTRLC